MENFQVGIREWMYGLSSAEEFLDREDIQIYLAEIKQSEVIGVENEETD